MSTYGNMSTRKSPDETRGDIRETFRKWRSVEEFDIVPRDPATDGSTVEFWVRGDKRTLTCTRFYSYRVNIRAVYLTLEALRKAEERGILRELVAAAAGFLEAPKGERAKRPWFEVLAVTSTSPIEVVKAAYKALSRKAHPDGGGSDELMAELNQALEDAEKERGE